MTNYEELENAKGSVEVLAQGIAKALENAVEGLKRIFEELPPYLKYEYSHPRKKPRGSLRRLRREQRNDKRRSNQHYESNSAYA